MKKLDHPEAKLPVGLSNPARRALVQAGITDFQQLVRFSEGEISKLHGVGPNAIKQLRAALEARGLSFASKK
jgi:hypothetical protein